MPSLSCRLAKKWQKKMVKILYIYTTVYMDILKYIHIYTPMYIYCTNTHMHTAAGWKLHVTTSTSWPQNTFGIIKTSNVQLQSPIPWQSS